MTKADYKINTRCRIKSGWSRKQLAFFGISDCKARNENEAKRPVGKLHCIMRKVIKTANEDAHACVC